MAGCSQFCALVCIDRFGLNWKCVGRTKCSHTGKAIGWQPDCFHRTGCDGDCLDLAIGMAGCLRCDTVDSCIASIEVDIFQLLQRKHA